MAEINIAIDGYSSCGKSTLAKQLAEKMNYLYADTGAMYRATALFAMENGCFSGTHLDGPALIERLNEIQIRFERDDSGHLETFLNGRNAEAEIRGMEVSNNVSKVAAVKEVRKMLVAQQREMAAEKGMVMDGRDIGTVVLPDAELKLFMTASHEVRTKRRYDELREKGVEIAIEEVSANLRERDRIDTTRKEDPLWQADDAVLLDNSNLSRIEQLEMVLVLARLRASGGEG